MKTALTWATLPLLVLACRSESHDGDRLATGTSDLKAALAVTEAETPRRAAPATAPRALPPEAAFKRGTELMAKRQFAEALPFLEQTRAAFPELASVLWNLGLASAELAQHDKALGYWQKYDRAQPGDWRALPKLIQAHQALGDKGARDRQIETLYAMRNGVDAPELQKVDRYCREQFTVLGQKVFAFEFFEPKSESPVFYRFSVVDPAVGKETSAITLASEDTTTATERELGHVSADARVYQLDHDTGSGPQTLAFYEEKPTYDLVRTAVLVSLQLQGQPLTSSSLDQ